MRRLLADAVRGLGPSSTKVVFLATGLAGVLASLVLTFVFCWVYAAHRVADAAFAGAVASAWAVAYGFVSGVMHRRNTLEHGKAKTDEPTP